MLLLCEESFINDALEPWKMKHHLERLHSYKNNKNLDYFKALKEKKINRPNLNIFFKAAASVDKGRLKASYNICVTLTKTGKSHTVAAITEVMIQR